MSDTAFSRPSAPTGFGKNTEPAKTLIPKDVHDELTVMVRTEGFETLSDWLRWVCIAKAKGVNTVRSVVERKLASVAAIVPEKDL